MSPRTPTRSSRRFDERGATAVFIALLVCFVVLPVGALGVDLGTQRVARRDMQALADTVALDLSRNLTNASTAASLYPTLQAKADLSLTRNRDASGFTTNATVTPDLGTLNPAMFGKPGYFTVLPKTSPVVPTAVRVSAETSVNFSFVASSGGAQRYAIAKGASSACFDMGSYAAAISSGNAALLSPLNGLLGINLSLVGYQGLAASSVSLAQLAATTSIGSIDQLLSGSVTLGQLVAASITALGNDHTQDNTAAIAALGLIQTSTGLGLSQPVNLAGIVSLDPTDRAALSSKVNVLDLIAGAIQVANGNHAVDISSLNIAGVTGSVSVIQGIQRGCGMPNSVRARATASQVKANLVVPLSLPTGSNVLGLTVTGGTTISGGLGNAQGQLVPLPAPRAPIECKSGTATDPDAYQVNVTNALAGVDSKTSLTLNGTVASGLLGGLLDPLLGAIASVKFEDVTVSITAAAVPSGTASGVELQVPQNAINTTPRGAPRQTGSAFGAQVVPSVATSTITGGKITIKSGLLGLTTTVLTIDLGSSGVVNNLVGTVVGTVTGVVNTAVVGTLNASLTPLARLLGVNAGGADVWSEYRPTCNGAQLAG